MVEAVAEYRKINRGISRTVILRCKVCSKSFGITTTAPGIYTPDVRQSWVCLGCGAKIKKGGVVMAKKKVEVKQEEVVGDVQEDVQEEKLDEVLVPAVSRNDLMLEAKEKGIKNFRILNKAELVRVLNPDILAERRDAIIVGAIARWKGGWGKKNVSI